MTTDLTNLKDQINELLRQKKRIIIAIDGSCTAGKTTLTGILAGEYDCNLFRMDDFFLRPQQRTPERYAEAGGNVDYERFQAEVLKPLLGGECFSYRPYDCKTFTLKDAVAVTPKHLNIIEGTYSLHPFFGDPFDLKIYLSVELEVQCRRILARQPHLHQQFFKMWIPMEHRYFREMAIPEKADLILELDI